MALSSQAKSILLLVDRMRNLDRLFLARVRPIARRPTAYLLSQAKKRKLLWWLANIPHCSSARQVSPLSSGALVTLANVPFLPDRLEMDLSKPDPQISFPRREDTRLGRRWRHILQEYAPFVYQSGCLPS